MNELIEFLKTYKLIHNRISTTRSEYSFESILPIGDVALPSSFEDFWTINISKNLTEEQAYEDCQKLFPCYKYNNLTDITSDRTSKKPYSIKVKANIEADENLKNISANDLKVKSITLLERLVLEKDYFQKTGQHLDIINLTLCSGSRRSGGGVPYVYWRDGRLRVDWDDAGSRDPDLRSRETWEVK